MNSDDKDNAIADAEKAGLYYSNNSDEGYTREIKEEKQLFLDVNGKPVFREDGKILKGTNYFKPKIKEILGWEAKFSFSSGVKIMLDNLKDWENAPLWTSDTIKKET